MTERRSFFRWRPHPWHGLSAGPHAPQRVLAYVEITPFDLMKYEVERETGYLIVDRPQLSSSLPPTLYGFIPRTCCGERVAALSDDAEKGDGDPLDICVISANPIDRADIILEATVLGGISTVDGGKSDDKIVAALAGDPYWGGISEIGELPPALVGRLRHYFATYKLIPGEGSTVSVGRVYDRAHAVSVVEAALEDYRTEYSD